MFRELSQKDIDELVKQNVALRSKVTGEVTTTKTGQIAEQAQIAKEALPISQLLTEALVEDVTKGETPEERRERERLGLPASKPLLMLISKEMKEQQAEAGKSKEIIQRLEQDAQNNRQVLLLLGEELIRQGAKHTEALQFIKNIETNSEQSEEFSGEEKKVILESVDDSFDFIEDDLDDEISELTASINEGVELLDKLEEGSTKDDMMNILNEAQDKLSDLLAQKEFFPAVKEIELEFTTVGDEFEKKEIDDIGDFIFNKGKTKEKLKKFVKITPEILIDLEKEVDIARDAEFGGFEQDYSPQNLDVVSSFSPRFVTNETTLLGFGNAEILYSIDDEGFLEPHGVSGDDVFKMTSILPIKLNEAEKDFLTSPKSVDKTIELLKENKIRINKISKIANDLANFKSDEEGVKIIKAFLRTGKRFPNVFQVANNLQNIVTGEGLSSNRVWNPPLHKKQNPYKIIGGRFGNLDIDEDLLRRFHHLKVNQGGRMIMDKRVDRNLVDLLTKRFNPRQRHDSESIKTFRDLVELSGLPINTGSGKFELLRSMLGRGTGGQVDVKIFTSIDELINRLGGIVSAMTAGNSNISLRNEMRQIADILLGKNILNQQEHQHMTERYGL